MRLLAYAQHVDKTANRLCRKCHHKLTELADLTRRAIALNQWLDLCRFQARWSEGSNLGCDRSDSTVMVCLVFDQRNHQVCLCVRDTTVAHEIFERLLIIFRELLPEHLLAGYVGSGSPLGNVFFDFVRSPVSAN